VRGKKNDVKSEGGRELIPSYKPENTGRNGGEKTAPSGSACRGKKKVRGEEIVAVT